MADRNSFNKVILAGYAANEPELKTVKTYNTNYCRFSLATNEWFKGDKKKTEYHYIISWGKTAEFCHKYITKGKFVIVEGKLRNRSWDDEGERRRITEVHVETMTLIGKMGEAIEQPPEEEEEETEEEKDPY